MTGMKQLGDVKIYLQWDFMCLDCSLKLQWHLQGKLLFFVSQQKREYVYKRGSCCAPTETFLWFSLLSSCLQYSRQNMDVWGDLEK